MSTPSELLLSQKYRKMLNLDKVDNTSDANKIINITQVSNLQSILDSKVNISGSNILSNVTINSNLYVSGIANLTNTYINSSLNVSSNATFYGPLQSNTMIISGDSTINASLYVSGYAQLNNGLYTSTINGLNNQLNIYADNIIIGTTGSIVTINGTSTYVAKTEDMYNGKIITLNYDSNTSQPADIGNDSGIYIVGSNGDGYIKTSSDASRFLIKSPNDITSNYIAVLYINNNFQVSGTAFIYGNCTLNSDINISGQTNINSNTKK